MPPPPTAAQGAGMVPPRAYGRKTHRVYATDRNGS